MHFILDKILKRSTYYTPFYRSSFQSYVISKTGFFGSPCIIHTLAFLIPSFPFLPLRYISPSPRTFFPSEAERVDRYPDINSSLSLTNNWPRHSSHAALIFSSPSAGHGLTIGYRLIGPVDPFRSFTSDAQNL